MKSIILALTIMALGFSAIANEEAKEEATNLFPPKQADKSKGTTPSKVELIEPKSFSEVAGPRVELQWKAAEGATSYKVQVATDPNFKWLVTEKDFLTETKFAVDGLESGKEYHWRVFPWKKDNDPTWTSGFPTRGTFTVK